jgi:ubiquinone/menaquinone biosynthesis C-methylase UbiE
MRTLDVGCGINKYPGSIGIDRIEGTAADLIADLEHLPYPLADNSFDHLRLIHVIEHLDDVIGTLEELHRLGRPGATLLIETPHYTDFSSFCDPTHKHHLNSFSLRYFGEDNAGFGYYTQVRFRQRRIRVRLLNVWRYVGFEFLINAFPRIRRFWEYYLCYVVRGKVITWELEVLK